MFEKRVPVMLVSLALLSLISVSPVVTGLSSSTSSHSRRPISNSTATMISTSVLISPSILPSLSPSLSESSEMPSPSPSSDFMSSTVTSSSTSSSSSSSSTSTSSTSTSTSTTPTPTPSHTPHPPEKEILVIEDNCFFFEATEIIFTYYDKRFSNTTTSHLSTLYPDPIDAVIGCTKDSRLHSFKRSYFNATSGSSVLNLTFEFALNYVEDSWYLSSLQVVNLTDGGRIFDYGTCGDAINVPEELSYFCSQVNCHGHEQVDDSISVSLDITNLRVDAFVKSGRDASSVVSMCGVSSSSNNKAVIIVALVVAITLVLSVIIIIVSFIYKRYRYGKYNLLD
ncbi:PREDICTED: uncharacterized serine-rich protein C215.13-like isoform X2 [Amphimedon queenslandica]|uniref:Lysosome-associated membrane glycoprotein 2-like luminal domain-containing protein n=1 Tax=Amphimedon queenslandica TaxID=400682 RepID=A0A1X7VVP7_AMPQE|nr:PREDICTED: uncharacterized serine-rich protein C215.13-like isoform X2 [Amphimedon queenslandica]|eukprot:XP_003382483.1 PREDICTED: uncharacterized serine-rich protein C215.13-like isoform X2 [Amphimedon queenslandica]